MVENQMPNNQMNQKFTPLNNPAEGEIAQGAFNRVNQFSDLNQTPQQPQPPAASTTGYGGQATLKQPAQQPQSISQLSQPNQPIHKFSTSPRLLRIIGGLVVFLVIVGLGIFLFRLPFKISVSPSAKVLIDKKDKGECANCSFWLKPGKHTIRFEKVGYRPETKIVEQSWFKIGSITLQLKEAPEMQTIDSGANVFIQKKNNLIQILYFNPTKKAFYSYSPQTKEKVQITPSYFSNLEKIKWSNTGEGVVVWLKYNATSLKNTPFLKDNLKNGDLAVFFYDFHRYEITKQQAYLWGTDINELAWAPVLGRFYYLGGTAGKGFLGKAEKSGRVKTRLLTNLPFSEGDLAIDSTEMIAYLLGGTSSKKIYSTNLTDPARELEPLLEESGKTNFILLNDDWMLIGSSQGNPEYKSQEKFSLYNLLDKQFKGNEFYANKDWFYQLDENNFVVLEAKTNSWVIKKITLPEIKEVFSYEFLTNEKPDQIWYNETGKTLLVSIKNTLYSLPLLFD